MSTAELIPEPNIVLVEPKITFVEPQVKLNFEEIKACAHKIAQQYDGVVVQENQIQAIRSEMAGMNALVAALKAKRKEFVAKISVPIKNLESQVEEIIEIILTARTGLDVQVKAFVEKERKQKQESVQLKIDKLKTEHNANDLTIEISETWLNKSTTDKTITATIENIIIKHNQEKANALMLEQAKSERILVIETQSKVCAKQHGFELSFAKFAQYQDLSITYATVIQSIETIYGKEAIKRQEALLMSRPVAPAPQAMGKVAVVPQTQPLTPVAPPQIPQTQQSLLAPQPTQIAQVLKEMVITATYDAVYGKEIEALFNQLNALCISCKAQVRTVR